MKKVSFIFSLSFLALGCLFSSCEKTPDVQEEGEEPTVTISADKVFNAENKANVTLSVSHVSGSDVSVVLEKAEPQPGKANVPVFYSKSVTIKAGETSKTIEVEADVLGLENGEYQAAIAVASASGAKVADNSVVYIDFKFEYKPEVNLYSDGSFAADKTAKLKLVLEKAATSDVTVTLKDGEGSKAAVSYEKSVVIPAGELEKEVVVTVEVPEGLEPGVYPAVIEIEKVVNAIKGNATSVTVNLSYPFSSVITIDGQFDDWGTPYIPTWTLPEADVLYGMLKTLKLTADAKRVFMYFEFEDPSKFGAKAPYETNTLPFNIYVDADGSPATGAVVAAVDNDTPYPPYSPEQMGLEYYIEVGLHNLDGEGGLGSIYDFYSAGGVYKYEGADGDGIFSKLTNLGGTYDGSAICAAGLYENGVGKVEIQMSREWFEMKGTKARFGIKIMDMANNWCALGLLPQGELVGDTRQHVDMASVTLPVYEN